MRAKDLSALFGRQPQPDPRDKVIEALTAQLEAQQRQIADLMDRLQEMIGQIHMHQVDKAVAEMIDASQQRAFQTDEDLDAQWQAAQGLSTQAELDERLRQIDLEHEFNSFDPASMI